MAGPKLAEMDQASGVSHEMQYGSTQPALVVVEHLRHAYGASTCMLTRFAVTLSDVHTDPGRLPSFAEECSFENWSSGSYH